MNKAKITTGAGRPYGAITIASFQAIIIWNTSAAAVCSVVSDLSVTGVIYVLRVLEPERLTLYLKFTLV